MLRDAALALFKADLAFIRTDLKEKSVGARIADRLGEGAHELLEDAVDYAEDNRGKLAGGLTALILWFARGPILEGLARLLGDDEEPGEAHGRSEDD